MHDRGSATRAPSAQGYSPPQTLPTDHASEGLTNLRKLQKRRRSRGKRKSQRKEETNLHLLLLLLLPRHPNKNARSNHIVRFARNHTAECVGTTTPTPGFTKVAAAANRTGNPPVAETVAGHQATGDAVTTAIGDRGHLVDAVPVGLTTETPHPE